MSMEEVMACAGPNTHLTFWGRTVHHVQSQHQIWDDDDKNNMWESSLLYKEIYEYELSLCTNRVIVVEDDWIGILEAKKIDLICFYSFKQLTVSQNVILPFIGIHWNFI